MTSEQIKILLKSRYINRSAVAVQVYPDKPESLAARLIDAKINEVKYKYLSAFERIEITRILNKLADKIHKAGSNEAAILELLKSPIIKRAEIAERLYPEYKTKAAVSNLSNKIHGAQNRKLTELEVIKIAGMLKELAETIRSQPAELSDGGADFSEKPAEAFTIDPAIFLPKKRD